MGEESNWRQSKMIRLAIACEGGTEVEFCNYILIPHFHKLNIDVTPINMKGGIGADKVVNQIKRLLPNYDYVTSLLDLYGFGKAFSKSKLQVEEALKNQVNNDRFIPYIQQYEFEALVFSDPELVAKHFRKMDEAKSLKAIVEKAGGCENINSSFVTTPYQRLKTILKNYDKIDSPMILKEIGIAKIKSECQGFAIWIDRLEEKTLK